MDFTPISNSYPSSFTSKRVTTTVSAVGRVGLCHVTLDETMVPHRRKGRLHLYAFFTPRSG